VEVDDQLSAGPDGRVIYEAGGNEEIFPLELNIERVRRSREMGVFTPWSTNEKLQRSHW